MATKDDIIKYVQHTPENTNPSVLGGLLSDLQEGKSIQADWNQNDPTKSDYVENRTHYSTLEFAFKAYASSGTACAHAYNDQLAKLKTAVICIEINGHKFMDLDRDTYGDSDPSVWADGGGMGFYIKRTNVDKQIYIDTNRYGPVSQAIINFYNQTVTKKLHGEYLPITSLNKLGAVKVEVDDSVQDIGSQYTKVIADSNGSLYSKEYNAAKVYSDLSIANLMAVADYSGDHGLYTDSIANDVSSAIELTLPAHAWFLGVDYSNYSAKFLIESADGSIWLIKLKSNSIISAENIYINNTNTGGSLIVTFNPGDHTCATHSPSEINEAFQSGKTVQFRVSDMAYPLIMCNASMAAFSLGIYDGDNAEFTTIVIDDNLKVTTSAPFLIPRLIAGGYINLDSIVLNSWTDGSNKQFRITVDDSGTISATEVTA